MKRNIEHLHSDGIIVICRQPGCDHGALQKLLLASCALIVFLLYTDRFRGCNE